MPKTIWISKDGNISHTAHQHDTEYVRRDVVDKQKDIWHKNAADFTKALNKHDLNYAMQPIRDVLEHGYRGKVDKVVTLEDAIEETLKRIDEK